MHLRSFPHTYVKGDERRLVYYSVEARELRLDGWEHEVKPKVEAEPEVDQEPTEVDPEEPLEPESVDFDAMTKRELLQYAMDRGADLPDNALKADIIEACKAL